VSDNHTGLPHDLPEYEPNWPVPAPVKVKARVYKRCGVWFWGHECPRRGMARVVALGHPQATLTAAFEAALRHARGCW
jgi:hypothetical protein